MVVYNRWIIITDTYIHIYLYNYAYFTHVFAHIYLK